MIKRIKKWFRRKPGLHKATLRIDFYQEDGVTPRIIWHRDGDREADTIAVVVFGYARILFELSELNEVRVARELTVFLDKVCQRVLASSETPQRPHLPLGQLHLVKDPGVKAVRSYQVEFYELAEGGFRMEYRGALGKESFYLPGAFLALLQSCLDHLGDEALRQLAQRLARLHDYYRYRRDFWEGGALTAGPACALGFQEIRLQESAPDADPVVEDSPGKS